jgi:hypothetical protein
VRICPAAIGGFLDSLPRLEIPPVRPGPAPHHYFDGTAVAAEWVFVLDALNYCFWPDTGSTRWEIDYQGNALSGYWGLAASLKRAMEEGIPIHRPETLATLKRNTLAYIFRGRGAIPLLGQRLAALRQIGQVLLDRFQGSFIHVLEEARGSAPNLALLVAREFAGFNDTATHCGETVYFFKRAQLLAFDLWQAFSGNSWGRLAGLDRLTAFADYKVPQVLRHLGITAYEPDLAERIDMLVPLPAGSPEEVEIRAATVCAVESIREEVVHRGGCATCAQLDNWLWTLGQEDTYRSRPYHRTRTIFY